MTLSEYLKSPRAVEDVRTLLRHEVGRVVYVCNDQGSLWRGLEEGPWHQVCVWLTTEAGREDVSCYYRPDGSGSGFVVSDCGETVSEVIRRTGKRFPDAAQMVTTLVDDAYMATAEIPELDCAIGPAGDLPGVIVMVLSAIARVREAQP